MQVQGNFRHPILGADTSNLTGRPWFVGDFHYLTVSIQSSTASSSRYTIVATNDDGLQSALGIPSQTVPANGWSIVSAIVNQGIYGFDVLGFRWVNMFRDGFSVSATSNVTIALAARP